MTKEKLLKKRKRDIILVVVFAIFIPVFAISVGLTNAYTGDDQTWAGFLSAFLVMLFIASIVLTVVFGNKLDEDTEKLSLIKSGMTPGDVEKKYQELKEQREKEAEQEKTNKKVTKTSYKSSSTGSRHYNVFDDHDWEHDVFNDSDLRDDDIMDFMDDDY